MRMRLRDCVSHMVRNQEGSQLVEMCLALFVMVALLIGTMELAMGFLAYNEVTDAAREAARWAMVRGDTSCTNTPSLSDCGAAINSTSSTSAISTHVRNMNLPLLVSSNITVTSTLLKATSTTPTSWATCTGGCLADPGNEIQVSVSYNLPIILNFWSSSNKFQAQRSTWSISNTATEVIAQ